MVEGMTLPRMERMERIERRWKGGEEVSVCILTVWHSKMIVERMERMERMERLMMMMMIRGPKNQGGFMQQVALEAFDKQ